MKIKNPSVDAKVATKGLLFNKRSVIFKDKILHMNKEKWCIDLCVVAMLLLESSQFPGWFVVHCSIKETWRHRTAGIHRVTARPLKLNLRGTLARQVRWGRTWPDPSRSDVVVR